MKLKAFELIAVVASVLICLTLGVFIGWESYNWKAYQDYGENITDIDMDTALDWLRITERSHQQFIDRPELATGGLLGDVEFHQDCIRRYQELRKFIINNCGGNVK